MSNIKIGDYVYARVTPFLVSQISCCRVVAIRKRFFLSQYLVRNTTIWTDNNNSETTRYEWKYGFQVTPTKIIKGV